MYDNKRDRGRHFAAWEEPEPCTGEVRAEHRIVRSADTA
jgi:hypothetical protein